MRDLSPGTELVHAETGCHYVISDVTEDTVTAYGPDGQLELPRDDLLDDIAAGTVTVRR